MAKIKVPEEWEKFLGTRFVQENEPGIFYTGKARISLDEMDATDREKIFSVAYDHWTAGKCDGLVFLNPETGDLIGRRRLSGNTDLLTEKPFLYILPGNILDTLDPEDFFSPEEMQDLGREILTEDYIQMMENDESEFRKRLLDILEYRAMEE